MQSIKSWLAAIITIGFLAALFVLFQVPLPETSKDILLVLIGCLTGIVKDVYGYYFGSSEGSARKTELMSSEADTATDTASDKTAGFARIRLLLPLSFLLCLLLALASIYGCASLKSDTPEAQAGKSLLAMKATIITAATAGDEMCHRKAIAPAVCMALADYYRKAQPAYDLTADSLRAVLLGKDPDAWRNYMRNQAMFRDIFDDMLLLSSQYGLLGGAK